MADKEAIGRQIMEGLYRDKMILTWYRDRPEGWTLASGLWSPFYLNLRLISGADPKLYKLAGRGMGMLLDEIGFSADGKHRVVGIAMAGIPFANAITLQKGIPSLYTRKLPEEIKTPEELDSYIKAHGQKALVEGEMKDGDTIAIIDDLVTRFDSKLLAISQVRQEASKRGVSISMKDVIVLVDREQGGSEKARAAGFNLHALIPFSSKGIGWLKGKFSEEEYNTITDYLKDPQKYQDKDMQERLKNAALKGRG
ncbi:MAG: hypothetical protein KGI00_00785 [Candidatus Micrarchaeota archaeon]|nr:hypothetical protein [Candidatus Micrarchaeota archaeon]MDE1824572.1 hypothetical protein [Candidatus Micrarchaeota archaeon]MDE1849246.1 hypothetical protein [Candidatus Micrarchaeota archaeon]